MSQLERSLMEKVAKYGDYTLYYYVDKGEIKTDVFLSHIGSYINSDGRTVHPKRNNASEVIEMIIEMRERKDRAIEQEQLRMF